MDIKLAQFCIIKSNSIPIDFETHIVKLNEKSILKKLFRLNILKILWKAMNSLFGLENANSKTTSSQAMVFTSYSELDDEQKYENTQEKLIDI